MSTSDHQETTDHDVTVGELLERQNGLEARIDQLESETDALHEKLERVNQQSLNQSVMNLLIAELVGDDVEIDFSNTPDENREALATVADRLVDLETSVELLQHQAAEVAE